MLSAVVYDTVVPRSTEPFKVTVKVAVPSPSLTNTSSIDIPAVILVDVSVAGLPILPTLSVRVTLKVILPSSSPLKLIPEIVCPAPVTVFVPVTLVPPLELLKL